jgi:hypothetical protein
MRKVGHLAAVICAVCLMIPLMGGISLGMAQPGPRLTAEQAIAMARRNAKPGSSFSVLWEVVANADTQRIGDQALEQARARKIELLEDGLLASILRSGGFLLAETDPKTTCVVTTHLVTLGSDGVPKDLFLPEDPHSGPGINLADARELVKDTTEFVEQLFSTPSTEDSSLVKFYGGSFPDGDRFPGTLFAIPSSLRKLGANPSEAQEAATLFGGYALWEFRYALSMPAFAASPVPALGAAEEKRETLKAEFLRSNHLDPKLDLDLDNVQSERQLQERIDLLTRLDKFLEEALKNESDPTVVRTNLSIAAMPLAVGVDLNQDEGQYVSSTPSMLAFVWHRLATGGFAVTTITAAD